jgi:hypothetical protein
MIHCGNFQKCQENNSCSFSLAWIRPHTAKVRNENDGKKIS